MPSASEAHAKLCDDHQAAAERYVINRTIAYTAFQNLTEAYEEAKKTLVESGALEVGQDGKIKAGWYKSDSGYESHRIEATSIQSNSRCQMLHRVSRDATVGERVELWEGWHPWFRRSMASS